MNETKPKKAIEYSEKAWNPFSGCDLWRTRECAVGEACWAHRMAKRLAGRCGYDKDDPFAPTMHWKRLWEPYERKKPTVFAVSFMGDISFCKPPDLHEILSVVRCNSHHTFVFLTKRPEIFAEAWSGQTLLKNMIFGTTVNLVKDHHRIDSLRKLDGRTWVSFEPPYELMRPNLEGIDYIAIGAQTGSRPFMPDPLIVGTLIQCARRENCKVLVKENLNWPVTIAEWPEEMYGGA